MSQLKHIIRNKLSDIEKSEGVKILLAVESGSRAWGFESKDSDYDVRFLYVRNQESYLKLEGIRDVIEWQLDDTLDINGWDIQKALKLAYKSNPTLFEWSASPIIYKQTEESLELQQLLIRYFSEKKALYHYWHMANTNYREYLKGERVKAKKYFYVLRPILASKWIAKYHSAPPIEFEQLVTHVLEEKLKPLVYQLLEMKKKTNEMDRIDKIAVLNDYIEEELVKIRKTAEEAVDTQKNQWEPLNQFFIQSIKNSYV